MQYQNQRALKVSCMDKEVGFMLLNDRPPNGSRRPWGLTLTGQNRHTSTAYE